MSAQHAFLDQFNAAFNRHDVAAMMAMMTDDCVFENTYPSPDGTRYEGWAAVKGFWEELFGVTPDAHISIEETFGCDERAVQRWVFSWVDPRQGAGHVRGVDVFRFRDGKIAEKLSYVKG